MPKAFKIGKVVGGGAMVAAGATTTVTSYLGSDIADLTIAVTVLILGVVILFTSLNHEAIRRHQIAADEAYELGYQMGHDKGYWEGRRAGRPTLVPIDKYRVDGARGGGTTVKRRRLATAAVRVDADDRRR